MHLGMTGWIHIRGMQTAYTRYAEKINGADKEVWPPKFWKFHLETDSDPEVGVAFTDARRFGRVRLVDCPGAEIRSNSPLVENGPDPVVDREIFTEEYLSKKMKGRHVPIKALLLDQAMISGIGNWVGDEIMYQAGLHPEQYSDDFSDSEITKLYKAICYVCDTAVEKLGDSDQFPEDWLFNHRWGKGKKDAAKTLPNGERIIFVTVGGRTSCVVPSRQKKTGRVVTGVEEEEPEEPKLEAKKKKASKQSSQYFDDSAKENEMIIKRMKAIKKEDDDDDIPTNKITKTKNKNPAPKTREKKTAPPPDTGTRRSTRLRKIS
ncbi:hypothetical protein NPX13_g6887 [Xylaria arbuscula]|uniref:Formamidopyrimidine-DNA glycosylase catalytic domain-containing protein n=1 Tax=Xylaria arbuscula TaxID=114810 RepID=A0A9W8NBR4_9PEZI|nr:hypothetical protein NPX13_g6887 [Xylaria arbuscula]